jgi:hypothetical protein
VKTLEELLKTYQEKNILEEKMLNDQKVEKKDSRKASKKNQGPYTYNPIHPPKIDSSRGGKTNKKIKSKRRHTKKRF